MRLVIDNGDISPEINVGNEINPIFRGHTISASVDRSEVIFFMAKGGIWAEYARYIRTLYFKDNKQDIYINEEK